MSTYDVILILATLTTTLVLYLMIERLPTVPSCSTCGSSNVSTLIFASSAKDGVTPVVVLPESHRVQAFNSPTVTHVARHSLSAGRTAGHLLVLPECHILYFLLGTGSSLSFFVTRVSTTA